MKTFKRKRGDKMSATPCPDCRSKSTVSGKPNKTRGTTPHACLTCWNVFTTYPEPEKKTEATK